MSSKWTKATIADVLELVIDHRGKTPKKLGFDDFHCSGYPVLSAKHVKTSGLTSLDSIRYANESMYNKWMKVPLQKGDVILTSEAPMGETYYIDGSVQYLLGQRVFGLRPKQELIEPLYLLSWLSSQVGQSKLKPALFMSTKNTAQLRWIAAAVRTTQPQPNFCSLKTQFPRRSWQNPAKFQLVGCFFRHRNESIPQRMADSVMSPAKSDIYVGD